jgi:hypothetical protein
LFLVSFRPYRVVNRHGHFREIRPAAFNPRMFMRLSDDVSELTPEQRRRELVAILAVGVLRLRQRRLRAGEPAAPPPKTAPDSAAGRLEVGPETVLSVHTG